MGHMPIEPLPSNSGGEPCSCSGSSSDRSQSCSTTAARSEAYEVAGVPPRACHLCGGTGHVGDAECPSPGCKIVRDMECLIGSYREELRVKNIRILKLEKECEDLAQMVLRYAPKVIAKV